MKFDYSVKPFCSVQNWVQILNAFGSIGVLLTQKFLLRSSEYLFESKAIWPTRKFPLIKQVEVVCVTPINRVLGLFRKCQLK